MDRTSPIEALLFDLGGVVIDIDFEQMFCHWSPRSRLSLQQMKQRFRVDEPFKQHERGELDTRDYMRHLGRQLEIEATEDQIAAGWNALLIEQIDSALDLVDTARKHLPCYAFSNTSAVHRTEWGRRFPRVFESFEQLFLSFELGIRKPDPEAYRFVAGKIGVAPEKILFFDDTGENIEGARAAGLNAVQVRSPSDIEQALAGVGALNRGAG